MSSQPSLMLPAFSKSTVLPSGRNISVLLSIDFIQQLNIRSSAQLFCSKRIWSSVCNRNKVNKSISNLKVRGFNATFNNISLILWRTVLSVEKTGVYSHRDNHRPVARHWQTLSHNVVSSTPWAGFCSLLQSNLLNFYRAIF